MLTNAEAIVAIGEAIISAPSRYSAIDGPQASTGTPAVPLHSPVGIKGQLYSTPT
jgi:hypothetical protein